jgi:hypothetical protein
MDGGHAGRHYQGEEALARMYPPTATWREGYYEGATEEGEPVLFLIPRKTNVIARFQGVLKVRTSSATEDDDPNTLWFEAEDVGISPNGAFRHSSCPHVLFALHGGLGPDGEARGRCIGIVNGGANHGPWGTDFDFGGSQWTRWKASWKTTEDDLNAPRFVTAYPD